MKSYIWIILINALLLASLFFALPKTETILFFNDDRFDLNKKEHQYWKQEFVLKLQIEPKDRTLKSKQIEQTKDIIYKRLKKVGVEEIQIVNYEYEGEFEDENEEQYLEEHIKVTIQTSKDKSLVQKLITSTGEIRIMLPKEEIADLPEEEQLQKYLPENYTETKWDRSQFRNILINDLRTADGGRGYFGIFKLKYSNKKEFLGFLDENMEKEIGILNNSLVMPTPVQPELKNLFAVMIASDADEANIQDILLNTGYIPVKNIVSVSNTDLTPNIYKIDYIQVTLAILVSFLSLIIFLYQREVKEKEKILQMAFSLTLIFSISLTVLKIWQIPVDLFLLIPASILTTIFLKTMYTCPNESRIVLIMSVIVGVLMLTLGTGYISILGQFFLFIIILSFLTEILTKIYFENIKNIWDF